jgi:hypothetical protein
MKTAILEGQDVHCVANGLHVLLESLHVEYWPLDGRTALTGTLVVAGDVWKKISTINQITSEIKVSVDDERAFRIYDIRQQHITGGFGYESMDLIGISFVAWIEEIKTL